MIALPLPASAPLAREIMVAGGWLRVEGRSLRDLRISFAELLRVVAEDERPV